MDRLSNVSKGGSGSIFEREERTALPSAQHAREFYFSSSYETEAFLDLCLTLFLSSTIRGIKQTKPRFVSSLLATDDEAPQMTKERRQDVARACDNIPLILEDIVSGVQRVRPTTIEGRTVVDETRNALWRIVHDEKIVALISAMVNQRIGQKTDHDSGRSSSP